MRVLASAFVVVLAAVACSAPSPEERSGAATLQAGTVDPGHPAVGAIWQKNLGSVCTGTLIAPDVVLTAAHCIDDVDQLGFYTGTGTAQSEFEETPPATLTGHPVVAGATHPGYAAGGETCPNPTIDVGLLRLATPITDIAPAAASPTLGAAAGQSCDAVGFGDHDDAPGDTSAGQKRSGTEVVRAIAAHSLEVGLGTALADSGDSGGPLFCGAALVAVTSCHIDGSWPQHKVEHYARVDVAADWIQSQIAAWHAGRAP